MKSTFKYWLFTVSCLLLITHGSVLLGQSYPDRPIHFIVPYPAGGGADFVARLTGDKVSKTIGQPIVVENRGGAGGAIAFEYVTKSKPDGYTILLAAIGPTSINPSLYSNLNYAPLKDLAPVSNLTKNPFTLVLHPSVPVNSVKELIELAKAKPGSLNYASPGSGSLGHMTGELFNVRAGVKIVHIPYKGGAPARKDLLGGQVDMMFMNTSKSVPLIKADKLKAIAVTSLQRTDVLPDMPTMVEAGVPNFEAIAWNGLMVPAGTPKSIIAKLNEHFRKALETPDTIERLEKVGSSPAGCTPEEFEAFIKSEIKKWALVIKESGAKVD